MDEVSKLMQLVYRDHIVDTHNKRMALVSATYNLGKNSSITEVKKRNTKEGICSYMREYSKATLYNSKT